jgi:tRNA(Leu) C34 or U34 (ribose-2'-O)-methylase TrmL
MQNPHIRSLNLAMCAGIVLYDALRRSPPKEFSTHLLTE